MTRGSPRQEPVASTRNGRGRAKIGRHQLEVTLPDGLWNELQAQEQALGVYKTAFVRQALRSYFGTNNPPV